MAKEFRLSAVVPVSDELFESAEKIAAIKPVVERFAGELRKIDGAEASWELVTPRPREKGADRPSLVGGTAA